MLILKFSTALAMLVGIVVGMKRFNEHCMSRFGHSFFTKAAFYRTAIALGLVIAGDVWRESVTQHHGDTLDGLLLIAVGIGVAFWLVRWNVQRTNVLYGLGGSALQIGVFSVLAWASIPVLVLALLFQFIVLSVAQPVYIVNR